MQDAPLAVHHTEPSGIVRLGADNARESEQQAGPPSLARTFGRTRSLDRRSVVRSRNPHDRPFEGALLTPRTPDLELQFAGPSEAGLTGGVKRLDSSAARGEAGA